MKETQIEFNNWTVELENRWLEFQVQSQPTYSTPQEYWMHRNCIMYDYEIHRLRRFNNPCRSCGIPLHLTKNFEVYGIGQICGLCHTLHTIIAANRYFSDLHDRWQAKQNEIKREDETGYTGLRGN